ncbi:MAG TPA: DUF5320 domain-containing protein [Candidatus Syntrophosphaera sp.]|nr:DUF5320 domain-containing protein [Candidatus Syntrophosphaera sp.]
MPNYDGTGPFGDGRPGRGLGPCGRFTGSSRGFFGPRLGRGSGRGLGWRNCRRYWQDFQLAATDQTAYPYSREELLAQKEDLHKQLLWVERHLDSSKESK